MEKIQIIDDSFLGFLMRLSLDYEPSNDKGEIKIESVYGRYPIDFTRRAQLEIIEQRAGKGELFSLKTTTSPHTLDGIKSTTQDMKRKVDASIMSPLSGLIHIRKEAAELEKFGRYIKKTYTPTDELSPKDRERLHDYWGTKETLLDNFFVSSTQRSAMNRYMQNYEQAYQKRSLEGQERWAQPEIYAKQILDKINSADFVKLFGTYRVAITAAGIVAFCHSLLYLKSTGQIEILDLREVPYKDKNGLQRKMWEVVLNNTAGKKQEQSISDPSPLPAADSVNIQMPPDCHWNETTFHCGTVSVPFSDAKTFKYFKLLTDELNKPVYNNDVYKDFGYSKPSQIANGVKKDIARRLDEKGLLKRDNRPNGRIAITPNSKVSGLKDKRAGYACSIAALRQ